MGIGEDVGIDAHRKTRADLEFAGARLEQRKLRLALHVKLEDSGLQSEVDLRGSLSHAGENHAAGGFGCSSDHALEFATGDDVEACTAISQQLENRERGVGFDCVTYKMVTPAEGFLKQAQALGDGVCRIDVERRAEAPGEGFKRYFAAIKRSAGLRMVKRACCLGHGTHLKTTRILY